MHPGSGTAFKVLTATTSVRGRWADPKKESIMMRHLRGWNAGSLLVAVVVLLGVLPAAAEAAWLGFRNDTNGTIVVQGASIVNNLPRWGKPYRLLPGEVYWENILVQGNKLIAVYNVNQPNRPLHQEIIQCAGSDLFYTVEIELGTPGGNGQPPTPPKVKLTPTKPPEAPKKERPRRGGGL
jgi:hypothetical protein